MQAEPHIYIWFIDVLVYFHVIYFIIILTLKTELLTTHNIPNIVVWICHPITNVPNIPKYKCHIHHTWYRVSCIFVIDKCTLQSLWCYSLRDSEVIQYTSLMSNCTWILYVYLWIHSLVQLKPEPTNR
jgi:hypothetical protein